MDLVKGKSASFDISFIKTFKLVLVNKQFCFSPLAVTFVSFDGTGM